MQCSSSNTQSTPWTFKSHFNLQEPKDRQSVVLVFAGTGINFWTYYPILQEFSLPDIRDFAGVYGISGGAGSAWIYGATSMIYFAGPYFPNTINGCVANSIKLRAPDAC